MLRNENLADWEKALKGLMEPTNDYENTKSQVGRLG